MGSIQNETQREKNKKEEEEMNQSSLSFETNSREIIMCSESPRGRGGVY